MGSIGRGSSDFPAFSIDEMTILLRWDPQPTGLEHDNLAGRRLSEAQSGSE